MQDLNSSIKVILVEDNEAQRTLLADFLDEAGFEVVSRVGTIKAATLAILTHVPDVAVIDNHLPDSRGVDLCRTVSNAGLAVALILHTGSISASEEHEARKVGAADVVLKSIRNRELTEAIRRNGFRSQPQRVESLS